MGQLEHEVGREAVGITLDRLVERLGGNAAQGGKVGMAREFATEGSAVRDALVGGTGFGANSTAL